MHGWSVVDVASTAPTVKAVGGEEFVYGEFDVAEDLAGVVFAAAAGAFLLGHAVIVCGNEKLGFALQTDQGELAQGDIYALPVIPETEVAAKAGTDAGRDLGKLAVTGTALAYVHQLHAQDNGVDSLHNGGGKAAAAQILLI